MKPLSFPLKSDKIDMSTSVMTYHASCKQRDTSHDIKARVQIPHPLCMGIKFLTPREGKGVKCLGYACGGVEWGDVEASIWQYIKCHLSLCGKLRYENAMTTHMAVTHIFFLGEVISPLPPPPQKKKELQAKSFPELKRLVKVDNQTLNLFFNFPVAFKHQFDKVMWCAF